MIACTLLAVALLAPSPDVHSVSVKERSVHEVAAGVYVLREPDAPDAFPQGNVTIVVGRDAALVVDSRYLPSSAGRDIAFLRDKTNVPARWLVNTHWHIDHTLGNAAWRAAFPDLHIVAQTETARQSAGYNPGWFAKYPDRAERLQKVLDDGRTSDGHVLTESERAEYSAAIGGTAAVAAEFAQVRDVHPDVTFDAALALDLGGRRAEVRFLGRGNTLGDAVVWLPDERVLVAGDLVDHPVPYHYGGFPFAQVDTLRALRRFDAKVLVPGHGAPLRQPAAFEHVDAMIGLLDEVTGLVRRHVYLHGSGSTNLDAVRKGVLADLDAANWRQRFAQGNAENEAFFDSSLAGLITAAYREMWGN